MSRSHYRWLAEVVLLDLALLFAPLLVIDWSVNFLKQFPKEETGNVLQITGFLLAGSLAGVFSLSYQHVRLANPTHRWFAHLTKFLFQFTIGWNFVLALGVLTPGRYVDLWFFVAASIYLSILLFNVWDMLRALPNEA